MGLLVMRVRTWGIVGVVDSRLRVVFEDGEFLKWMQY